MAEKAIERLVAVGAIKKKNKMLVSTGNLFVDPKGIPSSAVKEFHHQIMKKADDAIETQGLEHRDVASVVMCFEKRNTPKSELKNSEKSSKLNLRQIKKPPSKRSMLLVFSFFN